MTHVADKKSRQLIRQLHRANAALRVAVIGCYGEMSPEQAAALEGVALVVPNRDKENVLERILPRGGRDRDRARPARLALGHTRAFVKIQDGCDNRCTYCIVRHRARSAAQPPAGGRPGRGARAPGGGLPARWC